MSNLSNKKCIPCKGDIPPLKEQDITRYLNELGNNWKVIAKHHLEKEYSFKNFIEALAFTNRVGEVAEKEGHHPDIYLAWGKVKLTIYTHKIEGLTESDFILAAKAGQISI